MNEWSVKRQSTFCTINNDDLHLRKHPSAKSDPKSAPAAPLTPAAATAALSVAVGTGVPAELLTVTLTGIVAVPLVLKLVLTLSVAVALSDTVTLTGTAIVALPLVEKLVEWLDRDKTNRQDLMVCASHMLAGLGRSGEHFPSLRRSRRIQT